MYSNLSVDTLKLESIKKCCQIQSHEIKYSHKIRPKDKLSQDWGNYRLFCLGPSLIFNFLVGLLHISEPGNSYYSLFIAFKKKHYSVLSVHVVDGIPCVVLSLKDSKNSPNAFGVSSFLSRVLADVWTIQTVPGPLNVASGSL